MNRAFLLAPSLFAALSLVSAPFAQTRNPLAPAVKVAEKPPAPAAYPGVYVGVADVSSGGASFELARVLQLFADGRAALVSSFKGEKPALTPELTAKYGSLMAGIAQSGRVVHSGTWRMVEGKLDVTLAAAVSDGTTESAPARLTFERRDDRLVTLRTDAKLYGSEILRLRRVEIPGMTGSVAANVRVVRGLTQVSGALMADIAGKSVRIADNVLSGWRMRDGAAVVYTNAGQGGGFENEGQRLLSYDVNTKATRLLMVTPKRIDTVREVTTRGRRLAYVVLQADGGAGVPMCSVCNPDGAEVFRRDNAKFAGMQAGRMVLATYKPGAWDAGTKPAASSTVLVDLDELLPVSAVKP